ncbi:MAG: xanthine dehydrogenase family protein subunit M [Pseudomonadota bacterium]
MIPGSFAYHQPDSLEEALSLLSRFGDEARVLAGGHSLIPMMKLRLAAPEQLVDLQGVEGLSGITEADGALEIGAMTSQAELVGSETAARLCPLLRETALVIADPQVRYCGTIGGNVANGDPGNDMPAVMQCLGADYVLRSAEGERSLPARDFYEAAYFTALAEGEILTKIRVPIPPAGHGHAYEKQKRKVGDYATAAAAVVLTMVAGRCESASIALTNVADTPLHAEAASAALVGTAVDQAAIDSAVSAAEAITAPASDGRGSADYRTKVAGVMVRRAIQRALARAG